MKELTNGNKNLLGRVEKLETFEKESLVHFDDIDEQLRNLKSQIAQLLAGMKPSSGEGPDMSGFFKQLSELSELVNTKSSKDDLAKLRLELMEYTDKGDAGLKKQFEGAMEGLRFEIERNRATIETHISGDFKDLVQRVTVLEKRLQQLIAEMSGRRNEAPAPVFDDSELKRLADLLARLQNDHNNLTNQVNDGFS